MGIGVTVIHWEAFLLVLVRVLAMLMTVPVLGARPIPTQVRIGLAVLLATMLTPLQASDGPLLTDGITILVLVVKEVVVGLLLGFSGTLVFTAVQMATQLIGVQLGYSFSNTVDPMSSQSVGFLDTFYNMLAVVAFMGLGGHHALISGLAHSFEVVPLGEFAIAAATGQKLVLLLSASFGIAVRLALPIVGTMLLVDAVMALVVRSIPQMNVFVVGMPVKMVMGMVTMIALVPLMVMGIGDVARSVAAAVAGVLS